MEIRPIRTDELTAWLELRALLWHDHTREELERDQSRILRDMERNAVFVAAADDGTLVGFIEASIRDWAEGCTTEPVGYIEGWFVLPEHRQHGVGRRLVEAAESWALSKGCVEMGSDTDLDNDLSYKAHQALGYREAGRQVCFSKKLREGKTAA